MRPPNRNRRLLTIGLCAAGLVFGAWMLLSALQDNTQFFYDPSDIVANNFVPASDVIRVGGLVIDGSVVRGEGLQTDFEIHNFENTNGERLSVTHIGILPDLFREGQGVVMTGILQPNGTFNASELLAKHDENYRPKT